MEITLESLIIEGRPYQNYLNGIKDHETKKTLQWQSRYISK